MIYLLKGANYTKNLWRIVILNIGKINRYTNAQIVLERKKVIELIPVLKSLSTYLFNNNDRNGEYILGFAQFINN